MGPEGGRPGRPTQAVRHTCSRNLGIVKIAPHKQKSIKKYFWQEDGSPGQQGPVLKHNGKSGTVFGYLGA